LEARGTTHKKFQDLSRAKSDGDDDEWSIRNGEPRPRNDDLNGSPAAIPGLPVVNAPRLHFTFLVACHTVWMFVSFITESWLCLVKVSTPFLSLTSSRATSMDDLTCLQIDVLLLVLMSHHRSGLPACRQQSAESALSGMLS
jgi:hypothetical protein